jgi:hypothetical protein
MSSASDEEHNGLRCVREWEEEFNELLQEILYDEIMELEDEEEEQVEVKWGSSRPGKAPNKNRDFIQAHANSVKNYFSGTGSVYDENMLVRHLTTSCIA